MSWGSPPSRKRNIAISEPPLYTFSSSVGPHFAPSSSSFSGPLCQVRGLQDSLCAVLTVTGSCPCAPSCGKLMADTQRVSFLQQRPPDVDLWPPLQRAAWGSVSVAWVGSGLMTGLYQHPSCRSPVPTHSLPLPSFTQSCLGRNPNSETLHPLRKLWPWPGLCRETTELAQPL